MSDIDETRWSMIARIHQGAPAPPTGDPSQDFPARLLGFSASYWDGWRDHYEDHLKFAARSGRLDDTAFRGRLVAGLNENLAALAELEAAKFLEDRGAVITWEQPGRGSSVVDFCAELGGEPVYCEVKSILPERQAEGVERATGMIWAAAEQVERPFLLRVIVQHAAGGLSRRALTAFLDAELGTISSGHLARFPGPPVKTLSYSGPGVSVLFDVYPNEGSPRVQCITGVEWVNMNGKERILDALKNAHGQLPEARTLVILRPFLQFPLRTDELLNALFGDAGVSFFPDGTTRETRLPGGWLCGTTRRARVSAIALVQAAGVTSGEPLAMEIVHNPRATYAWRWDSLRRERVRSLVPQGDLLSWMEEAPAA